MKYNISIKYNASANLDQTVVLTEVVAKGNNFEELLHNSEAYFENLHGNTTWDKYTIFDLSKNLYRQIQKDILVSMLEADFEQDTKELL